MTTARKRPRWTRWAVFVLFVVISLAAVELIIGATGVAQRDFGLFVPGKGALYVPNASYRFEFEGFSEGHFNSHGFRDYERTIEKPRGTFRIAIIGDSYVEGLHVDLSETFPALLDQHFDHGAISQNVEVLTFGHSAYGTSDALMYYLNYAAEYSPDMVVLAFVTRTDFADNSARLSPQAIRFFHSVTKEGRLALDRSGIEGYEASLTLPKRVWQKLRRRSYVLSMISEYMYSKRNRRVVAGSDPSNGPRMPDGTAVSTSDAPIGPSDELNIFLEDPEPVWDEAFAHTARILAEFEREVTSRGTQFVIMSLSDSRQVHPEHQKLIEAKYGARFDYDRPDRFLGETARELGIPFLKLYPRLLEHHLATGEFVHGFDGSISGHWNAIGHRIAAKYLFEFLEPLVAGELSDRRQGDPRSTGPGAQ